MSKAKSTVLGFATREFVLMAVISVVSAVAYALLGQVWAAVTAGVGPLGGAAIGLFQFGHLMAYALIPKKGVAFGTSVLSTIVQAFMGDPAGIYVVGWGVAHGLGAEGVFAVGNYEKPGWGHLGMAAGVAAVLGHLWSYGLYGWSGEMVTFVISIPVLFIASAIESGALTWGVVRMVEEASGQSYLKS